MESKLLLVGVLALLMASFYLNNESQSTFDNSEIPPYVYDSFIHFKSSYSKKYSSAEENYRLAVYYENFLKIVEHSQDASATYELGETQFMDLTEQEFIDMYLMKDIGAYKQIAQTLSVEEDIENEDIDWTKKGAVTPVKNQGSCGSCWAFSVVGTLESHSIINKSQKVSLSEQQLVDCAGNEGADCYGCNGGWPNQALGWVNKHGLTAGSNYPYKAVTQKCARTEGEYQISKVYEPARSDTGLKSALKMNPVSICIDASRWSLYKGGVFNNCGTTPNHAVLLVASYSDYWLVKNSWGTGWGESGFIRLAPGNTCGIYNYAVIPQ